MLVSEIKRGSVWFLMSGLLIASSMGLNVSHAPVGAS